MEKDCNKCNGSGEVIKKAIKPDPIDGQYDTVHVNCSACKGTGKKRTRKRTKVKKVIKRKK